MKLIQKKINDQLRSELITNGIAEQSIFFKSIYLEGKPFTEQVVNKIPELVRYFKIYTE